MESNITKEDPKKNAANAQNTEIIGTVSFIKI